MKEENIHNSVDLEQLLRSKTWSQLSDSEKESLKEMVEGQEEYDRLYAIVHQLKTVIGAHESDLTPSGEVRENLLVAFDEQLRRRRRLWWTGMIFWWRDKLRLDIPAMQIGMATVVIAVMVVAVVTWSGNDTVSGTTVVKNEIPVIVPPQPAQEENSAAPAITDPIVVQETVIPDEPVQVPAQNETRPPVPSKELMDLLNALQHKKDHVGYGDGVVNNNEVVDTIAPQLAMNNEADTSAMVVPTIAVVPGAINACGDGASGIVLTNATSPSYALTAPVTNGTVLIPSGYNITVVGTPPTSRSLQQDADVINVFFALK